MQLVMDVGNTETLVGLATKPTEVGVSWRISSQVPRTADELTALLRSLLTGSSVDAAKIRRSVIASVVPSLNAVWSEALGNVEPIFNELQAELKAETDRLQRALTTFLPRMNQQLQRLRLDPISER